MIDLNELERLNKAATRGEWVQHSLMVSEAGFRPGVYRDICHCGLGARHSAEESERNSAAIAALHNAFPELLRLARIGQAAERSGVTQ